MVLVSATYRMNVKYVDRKAASGDDATEHAVQVGTRVHRVELIQLMISVE
jgi:hypothetical protein